jgi:hypothetical protein
MVVCQIRTSPVRKQQPERRHSLGRDTLQTNRRDDDRELETTIVDLACPKALDRVEARSWLGTPFAKEVGAIETSR